MTSAELAPDLIGLAVTLEDRAARIEALADEIAARCSAAAWQGSAADRFRATAQQRREQLRRAADGLRTGAHHARVLAATVAT